MENHIISYIQNYVEDLIRIRHDLHQHPETAFEEHRTAALIADYLEKHGLEVTQGIGCTGLVGTLKGNRPGKRVIGLRADMDALHIQETSDLPYKSSIEGKMHACGHDGHIAMLLGAVRYLSDNRDFAGTVQFVFQPAEEGLGGAKVMMDDGLFERFPCDAVYGMHSMPFGEAGTFGIRSGPLMAAGDTWTVIFKGSGGHGAMPSLATDPVMPATQFLSGIQTILSRNISHADEAAISIGHMKAGMYDSPNIIPAEVIIRGTARSFNPDVQDLIEKRITSLAKNTASAFDCQADVEYLRRYPALVNWDQQTQLAIQAASAVAGKENVDPDIQKDTGSEDFAFMVQEVPGAYIVINSGDGPCIHTPDYDFNDEIIAIGATYWSKLIELELAEV